MPSKTLVLYLRDEIFAIHVPLLVTIDARSTTLLNIELASDRSAETWSAHCEAREEHHCCSLGLASDRGRGLGAGYQAAYDMALWVAEYFHEFRALCELLHQWERTASAAMANADDAARTFARANSESTLPKPLQQYDTAHDACEQALALSDHLALRRHLLRDAFDFGSPHGRRRTVANVRAALSRLCDLIAALDGAASTHTLTPMHKPIDDIVVPFKHAEAIAAERRAVVPHDAFEFLGLAWHHDHVVYQSGAKHKDDQQRERAIWLACADGLLGDEFDTLKALVFDTLNAIVRASSLVEMVHALMRPYLKSCKGQITPEAVNLIMFYHNHRRDKSGKRQGKAPLLHS